MVMAMARKAKPIRPIEPGRQKIVSESFGQCRADNSSKRNARGPYIPEALKSRAKRMAYFLMRSVERLVMLNASARRRASRPSIARGHVAKSSIGEAVSDRTLRRRSAASVDLPRPLLHAPRTTHRVVLGARKLTKSSVNDSDGGGDHMCRTYLLGSLS